MMPKERYIELDITYKCSAECLHCIFASSPRKGGLMPVEDARRYLAEVRKLGLGGRDVILTGGEPLLFYEHTLAIVRAAAEIGMAPLRLIQSNASWCTDDEMTRSRLTDLRDAGLGGMYFSCDPFHQQFVPVERVRRGVRIADDVFGPEHVSVSGSRARLDDESPPSIDEHIEALPASPPVMVARAAWALGGHVPTIPLEEVLHMNCRGGRQDLDPASVWQINVDAYGYVSSWVCSGIVLGNALETPLSRIVTRGLAEHPPLVQDLVAHGPGAMLPMAARHGFRPREAYAGKCHLCWHIRETIHKHYPDLFAPEELYRD
ncbi:MAG: radical SAM protein [Phycisphaerae bacterium]|nr:radical SAM protein [Phycisphaerae bacterium]